MPNKTILSNLTTAKVTPICRDVSRLANALQCRMSKVCISKSMYPAAKVQTSINRTTEFRCLLATVWNSLLYAMRDWQQRVAARYVKRKRKTEGEDAWFLRRLQMTYLFYSSITFTKQAQNTVLSRPPFTHETPPLITPFTFLVIFTNRRIGLAWAGFFRSAGCSSAITWFWECWFKFTTRLQHFASHLEFLRMTCLP